MKLLQGIALAVRENPLVRLYRYYIIDSIIMLRRQGWRTLMRERGLKLLIFVFAYYLIRDTTLYIIIPYLVLKGL